MRAPLSWLKEFVDIAVPLDDLVHRMTMAGLEVGEVEHIGAEWQRDKLFVGEVMDVSSHPNADRLVLATVSYGPGEPQTVVTGAPNLRPGQRGQKVAFAVEGAELWDGYSDTPRRQALSRTRIRGVESAGMVCSEKELGLSDDHSGVIILDPGLPVGQPLQDALGDIVLDVELTPNVARANCIVGLAREIAALTGQPWRRLPADQASSAPACRRHRLRVGCQLRCRPVCPLFGVAYRERHHPALAAVDAAAAAIRRPAADQQYRGRNQLRDARNRPAPARL